MESIFKINKLVTVLTDFIVLLWQPNSQGWELIWHQCQDGWHWLLRLSHKTIRSRGLGRENLFHWGYLREHYGKAMVEGQNLEYLFSNLVVMTPDKFFFLRFYLFTFREKGRNREREKIINVWEINWSVASLSHVPNGGPGPQLKHVPWLGIKRATFWFAGWHSIHWSTPARARQIS